MSIHPEGKLCAVLLCSSRCVALHNPLPGRGTGGRWARVSAMVSLAVVTTSAPCLSTWFSSASARCAAFRNHDMRAPCHVKPPRAGERWPSPASQFELRRNKDATAQRHALLVSSLSAQIPPGNSGSAQDSAQYVHQYFQKAARPRDGIETGAGLQLHDKGCCGSGARGKRGVLRLPSLLGVKRCRFLERTTRLSERSLVLLLLAQKTRAASSVHFRRAATPRVTSRV